MVDDERVEVEEEGEVEEEITLELVASLMKHSLAPSSVIIAYHAMIFVSICVPAPPMFPLIFESPCAHKISFVQHFT